MFRAYHHINLATEHMCHCNLEPIDLFDYLLFAAIGCRLCQTFFPSVFELLFFAFLHVLHALHSSKLCFHPLCQTGYA
jgi:hypothetical protein